MTLAGRDLSIGYGDRVVGRGLDVSLAQGEVLALLGPNRKASRIVGEWDLDTHKGHCEFAGRFGEVDLPLQEHPVRLPPGRRVSDVGILFHRHGRVPLRAWAVERVEDVPIPLQRALCIGIAYLRREEGNRFTHPFLRRIGPIDDGLDDASDFSVPIGEINIQKINFLFCWISADCITDAV